MKQAIVLSESIRVENSSYWIMKRCENGIIIGQDGKEDRIAIHEHLVVKNTVALHPVVGAFSAEDSMGWVFPNFGTMHPHKWLRELRLTPPYRWHQLLKRHVEQVPSVKIALEDYSLGDLNELVKRGWYMGRSAHAPLYRIYGLIPEVRFEKVLPVFDGQMRTLDRFGTIYDPRCHKLEWKT